MTIKDIIQLTGLLMMAHQDGSHRTLLDLLRLS
jgi:hypothetical protein